MITMTIVGTLMIMGVVFYIAKGMLKAHGQMKHHKLAH